MLLPEPIITAMAEIAEAIKEEAKRSGRDEKELLGEAIEAFDQALEKYKEGKYANN